MTGQRRFSYSFGVVRHLVLFLIFPVVLSISMLAQSPVGEWKFNEGSGNIAFDSAGGHNALLWGGMRWASDTAGWAISADSGGRGYAAIPAIDLQNSRAVTVAFWAKRSYTTAGGGALIEAGDNYQNSSTGFSFLPDDDACHGIQAALRGDQGTTANCYTQPSSEVWHHLVIVYDKTQTGGNEVALYVDGLLQVPYRNLSAVSNTNNFGNDPIYLFSRGGRSQFSSGAVSDLRIYNRALTDGEIQQLYTNSPQQLSQSQGISFVQGNYAAPQTPQTTVNVTYTAAQSAGDLNVVAVGWNDSTAVVHSVTDSKGNTYTLAVGPTIQTGLATQSIYYAKNIAAAAAGSNTVTVTFSTGATFPDVRILEYSGADRNNPVDVTAASSGRGTLSSSGTATTTNATDLLFAANLVQTVTSGPGVNFISRMLTRPDGDIAEDRWVTAAGSYVATAPVVPVSPWIMQMVAFRTPAAGSFTLSASPSSLSVAQGGQGTSTITAAISGGFNSAISLSASGVPSGTTVSFNPNPIPAPGSGTSTMTINVGSSTPAGSYPITITGSGGGVQNTTTVTLTVTGAPSFTISASPSSLSVTQGHSGTSTITTAISNGFNSAISLSASGVPSGTTVSFSPNPISAPGSGSSTMTISVGSSTPTGTYPITVTGSGGGVTQTTTVTLTVTAPANFTLSASPSSLSVTQGHQGTSTITATISNGFNSAITLSASGMPTGTTVSFSPNPIAAPGSGSSTMTISVGSSTPTGTYPITVTGSGGGITQSTTVTLTVTAPANFTLSASPSSLTITEGNQGTSTISAAISNGFNSSISLSASGVPSGTTVSFSPNPIPAPGSGSSIMSIAVGSSTPVGTYAITVTGNGGGMTQSTTVTLTVIAPATFTISASPSSLSVAQGSQGNSTITTTALNGFNNSIALSTSGAPSGTTVSFSPATIPAPGSGSSSMTITVGSSTPTGTYSLTVTGSGGGVQQSAVVTLTVTATAATISYVQSNYATPQSPQTSVSVVYSAAQNAGDLNVIAVGWNDSTATVSSVHDTEGNVYTLAVGPTIQSGLATQSIYYAKNIVAAAAGSNTVTVTFSTAAVSPDIRIVEYSGADHNNPVDVTAANSGNGSSSSSGTATTTNATDLIFGADLTQTLTSGPGSGFTQRMLTQPDGDIAEDKMVTSAGSYSATAPISPSGAWIMQMVAFRTPVTGSFTISASPSSLTVGTGSQGTSTITTAVNGGFSGAITLSASGVPTGTTVSFSPNPIAAPGSGTSTMTIVVGSNTPGGTYPITVTGNGGGVQQSTTVTLTVTSAPNFSVSASPSSLSVMQETQGTSTITVTVSNGFNSSISLAASGMPSGTTVSFNPATLSAPGSGTSTMTITVGTSLQGTYPITITATGGGIHQTTTVNLTVTAQIMLSWTASQSPGIAGYNIYRGTITGGPYARINATLDPNITYNDTAVQDGVTYYYVTTAVDNQGQESSYSNESSAGVP